MTEFVIALPIFIVIFSGMGMLHTYSHEALVSRMKTNKSLVDNLTANNTIPDFIPAAAAAASIGSFGDVAVNGSGALGMYFDSALKAGAAEAIIPGQAIPAPASPPRTDIRQITGNTVGVTAQQSWTNMLMSDQAIPTWDTDGMGDWGGIITSVITSLGVPTSLGAGIRYLPIEAEESHSFSHPWTGETTYNPGKLRMPAPTAATHRLAPVAMSRIAMNTSSLHDVSKNPYKKCILTFEGFFAPDCTSAAGGSAGTYNGPPANSEFNEACSAQFQAYGGCMENCASAGGDGDTCELVCEDQEPPSQCENIADGVTDNIEEIFNPNACQGQGCEPVRRR